MKIVPFVAVAALFALPLATWRTLSFEMLYGLFSWALAIYLLAWMAPDAAKTLREGWAKIKGT